MHLQSSFRGLHCWYLLTNSPGRISRMHLLGAFVMLLVENVLRLLIHYWVVLPVWPRDTPGKRMERSSVEGCCHCTSSVLCWWVVDKSGIHWYFSPVIYTPSVPVCPVPKALALHRVTNIPPHLSHSGFPPKSIPRKHMTWVWGGGSTWWLF